ncbi:hypothetical protein ACJJTC_003675 [Scirpophaga incertulas]
MASEQSSGDEDFEGDSDSTNESLHSVVFAELQVPENIQAYIENRILIRDVEDFTCSDELLENVMNNYIIVKKIISNLSWQEKMLCKHVSTTWRSAVVALQKEQSGPQDFIVDLNQLNKFVKFIKSGNFDAEPMVVFVFTNEYAISTASKCLLLQPSPCDPACENEHCLIDYLQHQVAVPKNCMLSVRATYLSYSPLPHTPTYEYNISTRTLRAPLPFMAGLFIPVIPDVKFHTININFSNDIDLRKNFYDVVANLGRDNIFKGVLIYLSEKFILQQFFNQSSFLNFFREVQPETPYALGGCIIEDIIEQKEIKKIVDCQYEIHDNVSTFYVSPKLLTIGMFTVPKSVIFSEQGDMSNFDMYSLVIESSAWNKPCIQKTIIEFAGEVPRFEFSVAIKFSCVGRDQKHNIEEECFRSVFPDTRLIGCFGNGELGVNHPSRTPQKPQPKRPRMGRKFLELLYSYSTVFVYIGWGRKSSVKT